jgi:hypothetical protein
MLEHGFARSSVITRLRGGPLGPHLETLATTLHQRGYARNRTSRSRRTKMSGIAASHAN